MPTAIVPRTQRLNEIRRVLAGDQAQSQIDLAIRSHTIKPEQITRIALTTIANNPDLLDCTESSIVSAVITCCQLGLEPDNVSGLGYLVPYWDNSGPTRVRHCQFIAGYKGLVQLAYRSGQVKSFETRIVWEKECEQGLFDLDWGRTPPISHKPIRDKDRGPIAAVYAHIKLIGGGDVWEHMWAHEVDEVRDRYAKSAGNSRSPWKTSYPAMCRKTVARAGSKWVPSSPELQRAIAMDERVEYGLPPHLEMIDVPVATNGDAPTQSTTDLADKLRTPEPAPPPAPAETTAKGQAAKAEPRAKKEDRPDPAIAMHIMAIEHYGLTCTTTAATTAYRAVLAQYIGGTRKLAEATLDELKQIHEHLEKQPATPKPPPPAPVAEGQLPLA